MVVYVVSAADQKSNRRNSAIWLVPADGSQAPRALTTLGTSSAPGWSPDGASIAFLGTRTAPGDPTPARPQIYVMPLNGGEPRRVTSMPNGVVSFQWSPDGRKFAVVARTASSDAAPKSDAKRYLYPIYKYDGQGFTDDKRSHLFVVYASTGTSKQLTSGEQENQTNAQWAPDGRRIAYVFDKTDALNFRNSGLRILPAEGGAAMPVGDLDTGYRSYSWSPDGKRIAFIAAADEVNIPKLYTASTLDRTKAQLVTDEFSFATEVDWVAEGKGLAFTGQYKGEHPLFHVDLASHKITRLLAEGGIRQFDINEKAGRIAFTGNGADGPGEIFVSALGLKDRRQLSRHNEEWLRGREMSKFERVPFKAADGLEVEGFLMKPVGWQPGKSYPMILSIHGGPNGMHGPTWNHDFQVFAARGYAVFLTNPRGSSGYGEKFQRGVDKEWGGKAYEDIMTGVDTVLQKNPWIDRNRLGVTGLSYGGFMTNWIVGHTTRFKAAVTLSSISNFASVEGTRDGFYGHARDFGGDFFDNFDTYWKTSPLRYAKSVKTPTLIIHGEADHRVPQEQAEQWFRALKRFGVESELILFPRETHGLRTEPKHTLEILDLTLGWFDRLLKS